MVSNSKLTFESCGLDAEYNFLQAPMCTCGCGEYANLVLETKQDLYDFIGTMLEEHECNFCAIFTMCLDGSVIMGIKLEDGIKIYGTNNAEKESDMREMIAAVQEEFEFHCYGLMQQVDVNLYSIIME